jgi:hypothetical protein
MKDTKFPERIKKFKKMEQMSLFQIVTQPSKYSNTIHLYDAIPKYDRWNNSKVAIRQEPLHREFVFDKHEYQVDIIPARIEGKDGIYRDHFPGNREEIVEDALRKLATDGKGFYLDNKAGVVFTLTELQNELKRSGHDLNINQIKEALAICSRTHIELSNADGTSVISSNIFESLGMSTRAEWLKTSGDARCFVRFNILVDRCIREGTFRQYDYVTCMSYKKIMARYLHKRLAHIFTQASVTQTFTIKVTTLIRESGGKFYKSLATNIREIKKALDEMIDKETVHKYQIDNTYNGRKIIDGMITIVTAPKFNYAAKRATAINKLIKKDTVQTP